MYALDETSKILNKSIQNLLSVTDRVLLDIKYTSDILYSENVGSSLSEVLNFLDYLNNNSIPTTLRQVIIPGINDDTENMLLLKQIAKANACVDKIELLPFKKICQTKYDSMGLEFPFKDVPQPEKMVMDKLKTLIKEYI